MPLRFGHSLRFKSCPRVGGIHLPGWMPKMAWRFKSCPRVGGIFKAPLSMCFADVSSRAPVWGASPDLPCHFCLR